MYLTNILHIEEGNPDFLPKAAEGLINFSKRRKVAEITGEIQQYQNQPYCLEVEPRIRHFLETLQPFEGQNEHEISNYLYNRSKEIEPKNCKKPPTKDRKWPASFLKSPGIKPRSSRTVPNPLQPYFDRGQKLVDVGDGDDTPHVITPPTPSTPCTPPPPAIADSCIFAPVEIGNSAPPPLPDNRISSGGYPFSSTGISLPHPVPPPVTVNPHIPIPAAAAAVAAAASTPQVPPPPLPPRVRKREPSIGDTSPKVKQAPDAPELPPRDVSPPPIPPRTSTLPRMHSSGGLQHGPTHHHHHVPPGHHSLHCSVNYHLQAHHLSSHHHHRASPHSLFAPPPPPPPPQQYQLDPPPHRRNNSMDLSSPTPMARRHTNGPHAGLPGSNMNDGPAEPSDHPPTPPPRLNYRHTFSFPCDHHQS